MITAAPAEGAQKGLFHEDSSKIQNVLAFIRFIATSVDWIAATVIVATADVDGGGDYWVLAASYWDAEREHAAAAKTNCLDHTPKVVEGELKLMNQLLKSGKKTVIAAIVAA